MTKKQIIEQIKAEMRAEQTEREALRDAAFFTAFAKDRTLTREKFNKTYKQSPKNNTTVQERYTQYLIVQSNFKSDVPANFNNPKPEFKHLYSELSKYCKKFPAGKNLIFRGAAGTGKTYTAHIITKVLTNQGYNVLYLTAFGLLERFKKYVQNFGDETETDALFDCDMLVIDDLGTEPTVKNGIEYIYNVINERLVNAKHFIITTNLDEKGLQEKYDQRIASRILSKETSVVIEFKNKDLRLS